MCDKTVEMMKLFTGDYGISFIQDRSKRMFLKRRRDAPLRRKRGEVLKYTEKKEG